jgi:hypothetical protein
LVRTGRHRRNMNNVGKYLLWVLWSFYYLPQRRPKDLESYIIRMQRTRKPWWKFQPFCYYNEDGKQWEIRFTDESDYVKTGTIKAEIHIGQESGNIVGLTFWDENLEKIEPK